ncbi:hypothetical protein [Mycobacterium sp.]|uniref:hypothetical protein n=1 Tax=Mycobacterium sp. TaxID=1785 RepID=UPI003F9AF597
MNQVDGGTNVLDTQVSSAPAGTDQGSTDTFAQRQAEANAYRQAQRDAGLVTGAGAAGTVVAPAGQLETYGGQNDGSGSTVVAPNAYSYKSEGGDSGTDGTGRTVG